MIEESLMVYHILGYCEKSTRCTMVRSDWITQVMERDLVRVLKSYCLQTSLAWVYIIRCSAYNDFRQDYHNNKSNRATSLQE